MPYKEIPQTNVFNEIGTMEQLAMILDRMTNIFDLVTQVNIKYGNTQGHIKSATKYTCTSIYLHKTQSIGN